MKSKRGRPQIPEGYRRSAQLNVRLQPAELEELTKEAEQAGVTVSELARLKMCALITAQATNALRMEYRVTEGGRVVSAYSGAAMPKVLRFLADELEGGK